MFGHDPPINLRSINAVRWPAFAIVQAKYLPASPLPTTRISYSSMEFSIADYKAIRLPSVPQDGTRVHFCEFTGVVEIKRITNSFVERQIRRRDKYDAKYSVGQAPLRLPRVSEVRWRSAQT